MQASTRVAMNTGILYLRMLITVVISLYATRIILNALGATDFGIFNLIAGIIALLSFLNNAMSISTQRYLSFYQGLNDAVMQSKIFRHSYLLHLLIGIFLILVLVSMRFVIFNGFLNIPIDRLEAAITVYYFMIAAVFFSIVSVPFVASLTAHENMFWVAFVALVEVLLRLGIAICLLKFSGDKLVLYAALTTLISVLSFLLYSMFCIKKFEECSLYLPKKTERNLIFELGTYAGWNLFGTLCFLGRTQGLAILLNLFLGSVVNAAYAIANQVTAQLSFFSSTMLRSLNPQIMKSEGAGDRQRMLRLSMMASKFGFLLLGMIAIPAIFEMKAILVFWLKEVPRYTIGFCQLVLIATLISQLTIGLQSAIQATGRIKVYQSLVGTLILLNLPIAYLILRLGLSANFALLSYCLIELIACGFRLLFAKKLTGLGIRHYIIHIVSHTAIPVIITALLGYGFMSYSDSTNYQIIVRMGIMISTFCVLVYFFSLEAAEKLLVKGIIQKVRMALRKERR